MFTRTVLVLLLLLPIVAMGGINKKKKKIGRSRCDSAPDESTRITCEQIYKMDQMARELENRTKPTFGNRTNNRFPVPTDPEHCIDIPCICRFYGGQMSGPACIYRDGRTLQKAVRKEYRMMSDQERNSFHNAFIQLKRDGRWDDFSTYHTDTQRSIGAHSGPAFLPWHREYVKRLEIRMRRIDPGIAIPYWDSTLDGDLADPRMSAIFADEFQGNVNNEGYVASGAFMGSRWRGNRGQPIRRLTGQRGRLFREEDLDQIFSEREIHRILAYTAPTAACSSRQDFSLLEYRHGNPHNFIGGDMLIQQTSTNDPMFFLHHSFVDLLWEQWRQQRQNRRQRETVYPRDDINCAARAHFSNSPMGPFQPMINIDGLSNAYTDNLYEYAPRPSCASGNNCGSRYLFCNRSDPRPRCSAKLMNGADCRRYTRGEDVCYNGNCIGGRCQQGRGPPTRPQPTAPPRVVTPPCNDSHQWCQSWAAEGECRQNPTWMRVNCRRSCGTCQRRATVSQRSRSTTTIKITGEKSIAGADQRRNETTTSLELRLLRTNKNM